MSPFFKAVFEKETVATSVKAALLVGSILGLINHGDHIFVNRDMAAFDWVKLAVTYLVPFCVATYGAARHATRHAGEKRDKNSKGNPEATGRP